jgi:hypothetical protein
MKEKKDDELKQTPQKGCRKNKVVAAIDPLGNITR